MNSWHQDLAFYAVPHGSFYLNSPRKKEVWPDPLYANVFGIVKTWYAFMLRVATYEEEPMASIAFIFCVNSVTHIENKQQS